MSFTKTVIKPLTLSCIPLFLGSVIFAGVIENYKDESTLKVKLLEDYFKPSRELSFSCLKSQNKLYLQYPIYSSSLRLFLEEMTHFIDNPSLSSHSDYELILKALAETHSKSGKELNKLEEEIENCKIQVFQSLEVLSLATGTFDKFTELSKIRADSLNAAYKYRSEKSKKNTSGIEVADMQSLMRSVVSIDFYSTKGQEEFKKKMADMLPIIEQHSEIMSETEIQMYTAESEFYSEARVAASIQISNKFKGGFLAWLF